MAINLYHSLTGPQQTSDATPSIVLIHGLFGMGSNLGGVARALKDVCRVYSLDLPNHGKSDWVAGADIATMADCVTNWMDEQGLPHAHFLGHSLGGKVAMQLALQQPDRVDSLCVADIAPVAYPPSHDGVLEALQAVADASVSSRSEARDIMVTFLAEDMLIQFLLMSLVRNPEGVYQWRFNLQEFTQNYGLLRAGLTMVEPFEKPVLFVKGGDSDYILPQHQERIIAFFPRASVKIMSGCGHWLHAQKPRLFNSIARRFFVPQKS
jgi:esterase